VDELGAVTAAMAKVAPASTTLIREPAAQRTPAPGVANFARMS